MANDKCCTMQPGFLVRDSQRKTGFGDLFCEPRLPKPKLVLRPSEGNRDLPWIQRIIMRRPRRSLDCRFRKPPAGQNPKNPRNPWERGRSSVSEVPGSDIDFQLRATWCWAEKQEKTFGRKQRSSMDSTNYHAVALPFARLPILRTPPGQNPKPDRGTNHDFRRTEPKFY